MSTYKENFCPELAKDKNCQDEDDVRDPNCFIILQLVSQTANDRYLAFGVRSDSEQHKGKHTSKFPDNFK